MSRHKAPVLAWNLLPAPFSALLAVRMGASHGPVILKGRTATPLSDDEVEITNRPTTSGEDNPEVGGSHWPSRPLGRTPDEFGNSIDQPDMTNPPTDGTHHAVGLLVTTQWSDGGSVRRALIH